MHSAAEEDYLKVILDLQASNAAATTSTLAARLGLRPASVTGMLQRLAQRRLVSYRPYQAVRLTPKGRATALATLRRHRLIELFLVEVLGLSWEAVHAEAERWEHVVSDEVVERMDALLGHPDRDPHGSPIPQRDGTLAASLARSLADFKEGQRVRVMEITDRDPQLLRYLGQRRIVPDAVVDVVQLDTFAGSIELRVGRRRVRLSREAAHQVRAIEETPRERAG